MEIDRTKLICFQIGINYADFNEVFASFFNMNTKIFLIFSILAYTVLFLVAYTVQCTVSYISNSEGKLLSETPQIILFFVIGRFFQQCPPKTFYTNQLGSGMIKWTAETFVICLFRTY